VNKAAQGPDAIANVGEPGAKDDTLGIKPPAIVLHLYGQCACMVMERDLSSRPSVGVFGYVLNRLRAREIHSRFGVLGGACHVARHRNLRAGPLSAHTHGFHDPRLGQ
jgi:hypothetical protein